MAISLASLKSGTSKAAPRIIIYGPEKIGKSTFAADSNRPVFIQTEDGLHNLDVQSFPLARSLAEVMEALTVLAVENHDFKTLAVDSVDWLESLIHQKVATDNNVKSIEEIPYGKGVIFAMDYWREYLDALNYLRDTKGMTIIQIAHSEIRKFNSPDSDAYDRFDIKLHKSAGAKLKEHSDAIFFVNYRIGTTKQDVGFNKKRTRAVGVGERILFTEERPTHIGGNRYSLPPEIPFTRDGTAWATIAENVPFFNQNATQNKE